MLSILSQITIKVPLSKLLRFPGHRSKVIAWVGGDDKKVKHDYNENHTLREDKKEKRKETKLEVVVSQIPQIFFGSYVN